DVLTHGFPLRTRRYRVKGTRRRGRQSAAAEDGKELSLCGTTRQAGTVRQRVLTFSGAAKQRKCKTGGPRRAKHKAAVSFFIFKRRAHARQYRHYSVSGRKKTSIFCVFSKNLWRPIS